MNAKEGVFLGFLKAAEKLRIPIYQRRYSWNIKQCVDLWNDIISIGKNEDNESNHFIGSVVYISEHSFAEELDTFLIIDGQQRITTLSLIICALCNYLKENPHFHDYTKLRNKYLINSDESGEDIYKLLLTKDDKNSFIKLLENISTDIDLAFDKNDSVRIQENYEFFKGKIDKEEFNTVFNGIKRLTFVQIDLERGKDNPQLIFESLNSTGLELSRADLIRNYILMGLESNEQEMLYNNYWYKMESRFHHSEKSKLFDSFIKDYLTIKLGRIPVEREIYEEFKMYSSKFNNIQELVADIEYYSKLYANLTFANDEDSDINLMFKNLNDLNYTVIRPFLLNVYKDYIDNIIDKSEFIEILELIESYLFRRYICEIPTPSLNKTFATLYSEIDKNNYVKSIAINFALKVHDQSYKRFPDDNEFKEKLLFKDIYNLNNRNYILGRLENYNHKEHLNVEDFTIEHIMPQTPNDDWRRDLGENWEDVYEKYIHTIGNLTLTGYNSELSNKSFIEKRDREGGFKDSHLRLNHYLTDKNTWNEELILERAEELINLSCNIWKYPKVDNIEELQTKLKTAKHEYTLDSHKYINEEPIKSLFEKIRTKICNLDSIVSEEPKKLYIAYKSSTNFVDIIPYKTSLVLSLSIPFDEINDPKEKCRDVEGVGRWGTGLTEFKLYSFDDIDYAFDLIKQAFNYVTYSN